MLRVDMKYARPGMSLALPVQNPTVPARMLLRVGYELTDEVIAKLKEVGVRSVWVRYPSLATLEHVIDAETVRAQSAIVTQVTDTFEQMQGQAVARLNYHEYTKAIAGLID